MTCLGENGVLDSLGRNSLSRFTKQCRSLLWRIEQKLLNAMSAALNLISEYLFHIICPQSDLRAIGKKFLPNEINSGRMEQVSVRAKYLLNVWFVPPF